MPHYKDGTPANIGDFVKGKPYNTPGEIVGTVIQITEGTDSCNCIVSFADPKVTDLPVHEFISAGIPVPLHIRRVVGGRLPSSSAGVMGTENVLIVPRYDYGALKDFIKV